MNQRREAVEKAHKDTFQWIFDQGETNSRSFTGIWNRLTRRKHTSFVNWLRKETGLFWIYGKPGAGKSTLMKYLMDDPRLEEHAKIWASPHKLSISSFYFWKQGTKLQKSLCGLYRALLWQILKDDPKLARRAFPGWQTSFGTTEPTLDALRTALDLLTKTRALRRKYLILIDGLDEYEGAEGATSVSQERLSNDLLQLVKTRSVKVVVASRPDRAFETHFSHGRKLAIHDLTARDIGIYAHDRLIDEGTTRPPGEDLNAHESAQLRRLVEAIVDTSQGVFLWARIVVELARVHIRDHHPLNELKEIVAQLPPGLEKLFDHIMDKISNLSKPEQVEGLRYLSLTSRWFIVHANHRPSDVYLLPISILGIGCELRSHNVTEPWLQDNAQRLAGIGWNESRIECRVKSCCFGLLETSDRIWDDPNSNRPITVHQPSPLRRVIRPLHRTLAEYLSGHTAMQCEQNLSLADNESFDANAAILLGLVVMKDCIYPLVSTLWRTPNQFQNVLIWNRLTEESTGRAQIAILAAFDRNVKAGFTALVTRFCHLDHDHELSCVSWNSKFHRLCGYEQDYVTAFEKVVLDFAWNRSHPLISKSHCFAGFLDLLAITITGNSNALLKHWTDNLNSGVAPLDAVISADHATRLLSYALNKKHLHSGTVLFRQSNDVRYELNVEAMQSLLRLGGSLEPLYGSNAWEIFLDDLFLQVTDYAFFRARNSFDAYGNGRSMLWGLEALRCLVSHGARQDAYRTWSVRLHEPMFTRGKRMFLEYRRYSVAQVVRQTAKMLRHESEVQPGLYASEITKLDSLQRCLEEHNANVAPRGRCTWSDLKVAGDVDRRHDAWERDNVDAAVSIALRTDCDITKYQEFQLRTLAGTPYTITWLPYGCRETDELPTSLKTDEPIDHWMNRPTSPKGGQPEEFDVVGWLIYETRVLVVGGLKHRLIYY
jgi:hypothetical protein